VEIQVDSKTVLPGPLDGLEEVTFGQKEKRRRRRGSQRKVDELLNETEKTHVHETFSKKGSPS